MFPINLGMCLEEVLLTPDVWKACIGKHVGSITLVCGRDFWSEIHKCSLLYRAQYRFLLSLSPSLFHSSTHFPSLLSP